MTPASHVIVCGAGPVGLLTALRLARAGVSVTVLEKRAQINTASKASTFHPPTLDILDRLGLFAPVRSRGFFVHEAQYRTVEGPFARFDFATIADLTDHPYRMHLEQAEVAKAAIEALNALPNARIMFEAEALSTHDLGERASVRFRHGGQEHEWHADFVLVANGGSSELRESMGIRFDGKIYPGEVLRVVTRTPMRTILPDMASLTYLFDGDRSVSFLEMADCWRIIMRPSDAALAAPERDCAWVERVLRDVLPATMTAPVVDGWDLYRASRRTASSYGRNRVFLMGDAAHVTNTRGGMNMNCGIHDGCVIGNAVIDALGSGDTAGVTASAEKRRTIAATLLAERTDRSVGDLAGWAARVRAIAADPATAREFLVQTSMLDMIDREDIHAH